MQRSSTWMMSGAQFDYTEGYYSPIQDCQYTWQYHCQGILYAGSCAGRANTRPPVAYIIGAVCDLWRVTSEVLSGIHLFAKLSAHSVKIPTKAVVGQVMPANQVPPVVLLEEALGVYLQPPTRMGLGGPGTPRPRGMA